MPHDHAYRCPICGRPYIQKGRRGICLGYKKQPKHEFDIITLKPQRGRVKGRKKGKRD